MQSNMNFSSKQSFIFTLNLIKLNFNISPQTVVTGKLQDVL